MDAAARHPQGFLLSTPSAEVFPWGCPNATCCCGAGVMGGGGGCTQLGPPLWGVQWDGGDRGAGSIIRLKGLCWMSAGTCVARCCQALQGSLSAFCSCGAGVRTGAGLCLWAGRSSSSLPAAQHRTSAGDGHVKIMLEELTQCCLHSAVPGQADAGELAAAAALPPAH